MTLSDITDIAVAGLVAQRVRMATTASNLANARTTKPPKAAPTGAATRSSRPRRSSRASRRGSIAMFARSE